MSRMFNAITCVVGLAVLVPAFVLLMQVGILGNIAAGTDSKGLPLTTWLGIITLLGGIAYLIALGLLVWRPQRNCQWCLYCSIGYATYVAVMIGYVSSGNFAEQVKTSGLVSALSDHVPDLLYVAVPLLFIALLMFRPRVEQVSGA